MALTDKLTTIANAIRTKDGSTGTMSLAQMAEHILAIPTGTTPAYKVVQGTHTLSSDVQGGTSFTITTNAGFTPDIAIIYSPSNIATTYTMLGAIRWTALAWRTSYPSFGFYHGTNASTVTGTNCSTSYGIKTMAANSMTVTTSSSSTNYYWRAGTYKWVYIKLG